MELNMKTHTLHRLWLTRGNTALLNPVAPLKPATNTHDNRRFLNPDSYIYGDSTTTQHGDCGISSG